ncbi:hypothetical protein ACWDUL_01890 [Nocardia niigatensis]
MTPWLRVVGFNSSPTRADYKHVADYKQLYSSQDVDGIELDFHFAPEDVGYALAKPAVYTVADVHGASSDSGEPAIGGGGRWLFMDDVEAINALGVVLGGCHTAIGDFARSKSVSRLLGGKGFLGGLGSIPPDDTRILVAAMVELRHTAKVPASSAQAQAFLDQALDAAIKARPQKALSKRWGPMQQTR